METDKFSTSQKPQKNYKNTYFSVLCRHKNCILNAYAGVRSFHSSCNFDTKKHPFFRVFFLRILERQFDSINTCWCRLLISLLRWLWLLIALLLLWLLISLLLLCRLLNLLSLLSLLISNFC